MPHELDHHLKRRKQIRETQKPNIKGDIIGNWSLTTQSHPTRSVRPWIHPKLPQWLQFFYCILQSISWRAASQSVASILGFGWIRPDPETKDFSIRPPEDTDHQLRPRGWSEPTLISWRSCTSLWPTIWGGDATVTTTSIIAALDLGEWRYPCPYPLLPQTHGWLCITNYGQWIANTSHQYIPPQLRLSQPPLVWVLDCLNILIPWCWLVIGSRTGLRTRPDHFAFLAFGRTNRIDIGVKGGQRWFWNSLLWPCSVPLTQVSEDMLISPLEDLKLYRDLIKRMVVVLRLQFSVSAPHMTNNVYNIVQRETSPAIALPIPGVLQHAREPWSQPDSAPVFSCHLHHMYRVQQTDAEFLILVVVSSA